MDGTVSGTVDLDQVCEIGWWINDKLKKDNASRVGRAMKAKFLRDRETAKL